MTTEDKIQRAEDIFDNLFNEPIFRVGLIQHLARCKECREKFFEILKHAKLIKGKKKHLEKLVVTSEVVETSDDKKWIYDDKHHMWIDVTMPEGLKDARPLK